MRILGAWVTLFRPLVQTIERDLRWSFDSPGSGSSLRTFDERWLAMSRASCSPIRETKASRMVRPA